MISEGNVIKDKYKIIKLLGQGGMAQVWLAEEITFGNRQVAIKALLPGLSPEEDQILQARFQREVKVCAELSKADTPNIVKALTAESYDDSSFLVLEYMPGGDLEQHISEYPGGMAIDDVLKIAKGILTALDAIHNHPHAIIHRDIKPSNILFNAKGEACLGDFGLVQMGMASGDISLFIKDGRIAFTPLYRAPELKDPKEIALAHSDIFSFGCVLWEMLTGRVYRKYKPKTKPSTLKSDIPDWLEKLTMQCLFEDGWERLQSASIILGEIQKHEPNGDGNDHEKLPRWVKLAIGFLCALTIGIFLYVRTGLFSSDISGIQTTPSQYIGSSVAIAKTTTPKATISAAVVPTKTQEVISFEKINPFSRFYPMHGVYVSFINESSENLLLYEVQSNGENFLSTLGSGKQIDLSSAIIQGVYAIRDSENNLIQLYANSSAEQQIVKINSHMVNYAQNQVNIETLSPLRTYWTEKYVTIEFLNNTSVSLKYYKIDQNGNELLIIESESGGRSTTSSNYGNAWAVRDADGKLIIYYIVTFDDSQLIQITEELRFASPYK